MLSNPDTLPDGPTVSGVLNPLKLQCYHTNGSDNQWHKWCEAIRIDILADGNEYNSGWDYYQLVVRNYDYNNSLGTLRDYSVYITYNVINGGSGTVAVKPQGGFVWCTNGQPTVTLSYSFLSVGLLIPCYQIDFWDNIGAVQDNSHWHAYLGAPLCNFYCEQGIDVSIPEGKGWTFTFHYRDETGVSYCQEAGGSPTNNAVCYFDMTYSITVPPGHVDPPPICGGGGCTSSTVCPKYL
jgi:hypothetical protein